MILLANHLAQRPCSYAVDGIDRVRRNDLSNQRICRFPFWRVVKFE